MDTSSPVFLEYMDKIRAIIWEERRERLLIDLHNWGRLPIGYAIVRLLWHHSHVATILAVITMILLAYAWLDWEQERVDKRIATIVESADLIVEKGIAVNAPGILWCILHFVEDPMPACVTFDNKQTILSFLNALCQIAEAKKFEMLSVVLPAVISYSYKASVEAGKRFVEGEAVATIHGEVHLDELLRRNPHGIGGEVLTEAVTRSTERHIQSLNRDLDSDGLDDEALEKWYQDATFVLEHLPYRVKLEEVQVTKGRG